MSGGKTLIAGGRVVDPARGVDGRLDVLIGDGRIEALAPGLALGSGVCSRILDASGKLIVPGLIDMHVHLREPGSQADETIATGAAAAVRGGFTAVAVMPSTDPAVDDEAAAEFQVLQGKRAGKARVYPIGAITRGRRGEALAELGGLARGGAVGFSDDQPLRSAEVLRCALLYAKMLDRVVITRAEDPDLAKNGVMHSGQVSLVLGMPGKSAASEEVMVARDITLAGLTGARLHLAPISTRGSVALVRDAKQRGIPVSCHVCPHHLVLTHEAVYSFDPCYKVDPPLRSESDREALLEGLADGTIDAVASDHSPVASERKHVEFPQAPNGVIGLETTVPVVFTELLERGLPLARLVELLSTGPSQILGLPGGSLAPGAPADLTVLDIEERWQIGPDFRSNSRNSPFVGRQVQARAVFTLVEGRVVYDRQAEEA